MVLQPFQVKWDTTEVRSTTVSDGSTIVPDYHGRCLRRALDIKVRNLQGLLSAHEDITTELDRVVCKLMKLALRSSRGRQSPPPTRWMQCKLLDLLTLTEKAIGRRKKQFIESYPVKAIEFEVKPQEIELEVEQDNRVKEIVDKYRHLITPVEKTTNTDDTNGPYIDDDIEDDFLSTTSNDFLKDNEYIEGISPSLVIPQPVFSSETFEAAESSPPNENPLERTKAWLDEDVEVVPYPKHEMNYENISSGDTDHSVSNAKHKHKKSTKKHKAISNKGIEELDTTLSKTCQSKNCHKLKIKREDSNKKKSSSTRISKKVARKKSGFNSLVKNPGGKYSSAEYESYGIRTKRKIKEPHSFNVTASKPIPESLIELCHPELKAEKGIEDYRVPNKAAESNDIVISNQPIYNISATEESCLIDIVMQDFEETIALRRTIGTDAEEVPEITSKVQAETLSNDLDVNLCIKHEVSTENVQSQTIFLNDINEPSTSKGIRHNISTDVQCGPDSLAAFPMLSASTSLVRMPQVFSTGIKIHDVVADTKVKGTDFGTSTQENNNLTTITPRMRSVGIKIKDSDVNICTKTECATMTVSETGPGPSPAVTYKPFSRSSAVNSAVSSPETKLLKPISSTLKIEDSGSEFCAPSNASSSKTLPYFMNTSKNTSVVLMESSASKENVVTDKKSATKYARPRLCCGGVHVHSYKDKQVSEDIVYQGEWQRYRPKALARKKPHNIMTTRKFNEAVARKKKENLKEQQKVNSKEKVESKKPSQTRNVKLHKVRQGVDTNGQNTKPKLLAEEEIAPSSDVKISPTTMKIPRPVKTVVTKVASKIAMSAINSKNGKSIKRPIISPNVTVKKDSEKPHKLKKSYIPLYLKRTAQLSASDKNNLNKSIDSAEAAMKDRLDDFVNKIAPLVRSNTDEIRKDLVKFSDDVRENISYVVFRNDLEDKIESPDEHNSDNNNDRNISTAKQSEMLKRSHSPQSLNSSTCSSPNSVATVRAASTRVKNMSYRRHATSSYRVSLNNSESDNSAPPKPKKSVKRCKSAKKPDSKDIDNKENIPESTRNFTNKDKDKISKSSFAGRHKSVYIAHLKAESSSTPTTLSRHKVQISNKSNIKIPTPKDGNDKQRSVSATASKRRSLKAETSSVYEDLNRSQKSLESYGSSGSANKVLVFETQSTGEELSGTQKKSQIPSECCAIKSETNILAEWVQNSSLHSQASSILNSVKQLLEETLDLIVSPHDHNMRYLDSKTVILSRDDIQKLNMDKVTSPGTNRVSNSDNLNMSFLESDIENALNRTFDTVLGDESMVSLNDTRLTVTDLDLLSFKSITSVSKYSEYFLADNEFSTSQAMEQTQTHNTSSVRDIFERKDPHIVQNTPGPLALQAFSGFSLNAESVAGDQPDAVAFIDSETGSLACDINRQATSEELFISGRSSDSYESCLIDEDAVVPNWLFQIISQQQSVEEDPVPVHFGPVPAPPDEPLYDANGNVIEPAVLGVGAGAGDGRGMHSDHSQDSSGRGTSLSSSDTSSGPQSEVSAILIDPSAFTAQFELLRDPMASSVLPFDSNANSSNNTYRIDDDAGTLIGLHEARTRMLNGASDVDADISSIDTDVPDSSDN